MAVVMGALSAGSLVPAGQWSVASTQGFPCATSVSMPSATAEMDAITSHTAEADVNIYPMNSELARALYRIVYYEPAA